MTSGLAELSWAALSRQCVPLRACLSPGTKGRLLSASSPLPPASSDFQEAPICGRCGPQRPSSDVGSGDLLACLRAWGLAREERLLHIMYNARRLPEFAEVRNQRGAAPCAQKVKRT